MNRSETETQLVTPSSPHTSSSSSSSSFSISCIGPYEALDSSEAEERVLTPTYPWDYEECDNENMEEGGQTCQIR